LLPAASVTFPASGFDPVALMVVGLFTAIPAPIRSKSLRLLH
jgi:hypothetical protein